VSLSEQEVLTYHLILNMNNTTVAAIEIGTAYPSGEHEFKPVVSGIRVV